jgi:uncharacterized repeat protein (TIGR01451 family)
MHHHRTWAVLLLLLAGRPAPAQFPHPHPLHHPPPCGPAPLLHVRFYGPPGLNVTLYQGALTGQTFPVPVTVGLRPGYIYRVKVSGFPEHPGVMLFPTLEVRGTLQLPPHVRAADFPAPVVFRDDDVVRVRGGSVLTRVVALEHPDQAVPSASRPDQPVEIDPPASQDPVAEARQRGRPMLIFRMGERALSPDEVARQAIPGTVLLPGDHCLGQPAAKPYLPWAGIPVYDPILGPRPPDEECLHDGGDVGQPAGIDHRGRLRGLDPSDTVAEYTDSGGRRRLACSNRVCLCVPRYIVIRTETLLAGYSTLVGPEDTRAVQGQLAIQRITPSAETSQAERAGRLHVPKRLQGTVNVQLLGQLERVEVLVPERLEIGPAEMLGTELLVTLTKEQRALLKRQIEFAFLMSQPYRLAGVEQILQGPAVVGRVEGVKLIATVQGPCELTVCCEKPVPPAKPLCLYKWADRQSAQVGDVVTFFIKYSNHGGKPITDVAVSDSLTARLEYIPGSARADRDAVFTLQNNEAGSVILRWEIGGKLLPCQSGVVSFQARVR